MKQQTQQLLIIAAVFAFLIYSTTPAEERAAWFQGGISAANGVAPSPGTGGGITVYGGTPTMEWAVKDALLGTEATLTGPHYRVTVDGFTKDYADDDTIDVSLGKSYTVCLKPNSTYYGVCKSGTVTDTVTKVVLETYKLGTATIWVNNDPENATTRNSSSAVDTLAANDDDTPQICVQGATANASYGNGKILFAIDYNSNELDQAPQLSVGRLCLECRPAGYSADANATDTVFYEYDVFLTNQETVCGTMTVSNGSETNIAISGTQSDPRIRVFDYAMFTHSTTDALVDAYARPTTGADTNSATNATAVYYYIN